MLGRVNSFPLEGQCTRKGTLGLIRPLGLPQQVGHFLQTRAIACAGVRVEHLPQHTLLHGFQALLL